jgi:hypothetical protein
VALHHRRPGLAGVAGYLILLAGCSRPAEPVAQSAAGPILPQEQPGAPVPPANVPQANPATPAPAEVPQAATADSYTDLYGDQGGEEVVPAGKAPANAPLRARKGDTFFKLSNPRIEPTGRRPFPALVVDYERVHDGPYGGQALIVRPDMGPDQTYLLLGPFASRAGKIEISLGIPVPGRPGPPKNAELFLTRQEHRYGGDFRPTFKVSNSVMMGMTRFPPTLARSWTAEEAAKLKQPPPEGPKFNSHPDTGEDTEFVGDTTGGGNFRYAEAGKAVLGVDYWSGEWDKEPCLANVIPVYDQKQPVEGTQRLMAKAGYAIGGMTVRTKRFVNAVRIVFMKLTPDGKLDPKDSYTSNWLGHEKVGLNEVKLGGDGRLVIGLNCKKGAILNALALVMDAAGGK